jgi:hypothetical protein
MRAVLISALLAFGLTGTVACAQDKVAEGEYELREADSGPGAPTFTPLSHWVLTSKSSGGYRLESESLHVPAGVRVVQSEELDERFVPTSVDYKFYRKDETTPSITVDCEMSDAVVCKGTSGADSVGASEPYTPNGPYFLWMAKDGLSAVDMPWLLDGAVNMAHLENGVAELATVNVFGGTAVTLGDAVNVAALEELKTKNPNMRVTVLQPDKPIAWQLSTQEEDQLRFLGTEAMEVDGTKVAANHYTYGNDRPLDLWTVGPGLIVKVDGFVLTNYKQYKKLIPEVGTQGQ